MKKIKKKRLIIFIIILVSLLIVSSALLLRTDKISFHASITSPTFTISGAGTHSEPQFQVIVNLATGGNNICAAEASLTFPKNIINVVSIVPSANYSMATVNTFSNINGTISYTAGVAGCTTTDGAFFTINFQNMATGTGLIAFTNAVAVGGDVNNQAEIPSINTPATITVPLQPPTINTVKAVTYQSSATLSGSVSAGTVSVAYVVNGGASQPLTLTGSNWTQVINFPTVGQLYKIDVTATDLSGQKATSTVSIRRNKMADSNNDSKINILDFGLLMANWNKTGDAMNYLADYNADAKVNIIDFGLLMANWTI